jgi:hypothetical protein
MTPRKNPEQRTLQLRNSERMNCNKVKENLRFIVPCIGNIFQYISNKMKFYTVYLYLETAFHVSGGTSTHHQERLQLYLQHLFICHTVTATCRYSDR